jgi:hypothetical protein
MIGSFFIDISYEKDKLYKKVIKAKCSQCLSYSSTTKKKLLYCQNKNCSNSYFYLKKGIKLSKEQLQEIFKKNILIEAPDYLFTKERDTNFLTFQCEETNCNQKIKAPYFRIIKRKKILCKKHATIFFNKTKKINYNEILTKINEKTKFKLITTEEEYKNLTTHDDLIFECSCGNQFKRTFQNAVHNSTKQCPTCAMNLINFVSNGELEVLEWLKTLNINVITQDKTILKTHYIDLYLPDFKLAIEYNGEYWHSFHNSNYHLDKTNTAKENNVKLLHIWENQWKTKQEIVKSIILSKIGKIKTIGARKTKLNLISFKEANDFFEKNHLQGKVIGSKVHIGLFLEDKLISCISFGKPRNSKKYEWEIFRFATLLNHSVIGGFSKMLKFFIKNHNPKSICSYADRQISDGDIYLKNNFKLISVSKPSYFYFKNGQVFHRFSFRKSRLKNADPTKTEFEIMSENKYLRNWDCGQYFFGLTL